MSNSSHTERKPVNIERLTLQSKVLATGTRAFLEAARAQLQSNGIRIRRILELGCAIGDETLLLAEYFPEAEIIAIDSMSEYIQVAQSRSLHPNIHFQTLPTESARLILQKVGGNLDLIYCRMFLMHFSDPQAYLNELSYSLKHGVYLAVEEPDSSKIGFQQESKELKRFVDLLLQFGISRQETYRLGPMLADIICKSGFVVKAKSVHHAKLGNDTEKQLIVQLAKDLAPKFSGLELAEPSELSSLSKCIESQIATGKLNSVDYCEMTQILARCSK